MLSGTSFLVLIPSIALWSFGLAPKRHLNWRSNWTGITQENDNSSQEEGIRFG